MEKKNIFYVRQFAGVEFTFNYVVQLISLDFFQPFSVILLKCRVGGIALAKKI